MSTLALSRAIALPGPLQRRLDNRARIFLQPPGGPLVDFGAPLGEPALVPHDSVSWRVFKNPLALFIGGIAAVLLELSEPRVRDAVWHHSSFPTDPLARLQRTGLAAMLTIYGPRSKAEGMIAGIVRKHDAVSGTTSCGDPYHANDPVLLDWVQATAGFGFTEAYSAYAHTLTAADRQSLFTEGRPIALLYGATGAPTSKAELNALFERMRPRLAPSPIVFEFLALMAKVPALPRPARPFQPLLLKAAVELLPAWVRDRLGLGPRWSLGRVERSLVRTAVRASDRLMLRSSPAVHSCRRLGLPDDYLYRRR